MSNKESINYSSGTILLHQIDDLQRLQASLRHHMNRRGVTIKDLHEGTGVATATIQRIRSGTTKPNLTVLEAIAKFFGISVTTLLSGHEDKNIELITEQIFKVPLIKWEAAALPNEDREISTHYVLVDLPISRYAFALQLEESLNPLFTKGSIIIIDPNGHPDNKDYLLVAKKGVLLPSIKQIVINDDKKILVPLSNLFEPDELSEKFIILGVIVQVKYNLKNTFLPK